MHFFLKDRSLRLWILKPNYVDIRDNKVLRPIQQPLLGTSGEPLLFSKCYKGSLTCITQRRGPSFYVPPKDKTLTVKCHDFRANTLLIRNTRVWVWCASPLKKVCFFFSNCYKKVRQSKHSFVHPATASLTQVTANQRKIDIKSLPLLWSQNCPLTMTDD